VLVVQMRYYDFQEHNNDLIKILDNSLEGFRKRGMKNTIFYTEASKLKSKIIFDFKKDYRQCLEILK
jgi:hypothetical protein